MQGIAKAPPTPPVSTVGSADTQSTLLQLQTISLLEGETMPEPDELNDHVWIAYLAAFPKVNIH